MNPQGLYRFIRYSAVGVSTFLLDLGIVFTLVNGLKIFYLYAVAIGFIIGVSCNYFISRIFVFKGTKRTLYHGYFYFITAGVLGLMVVLVLTGILVSIFGVSLLIARVIVAGIVGYSNYLFNLYVNFRVAKQKSL